MPHGILVPVDEQQGLVVAVTGHRPHKLGGEWDLEGPVSAKLFAALRRALDELRPSSVISGMALGVDTAWALVGIERGIPVTAAVPFEGFDARWSPAARRRYAEILSHPLVTKVIVAPGAYNPHKLQVRNEWMVNRCDLLLAVWDGTLGGTANCVRYAQRVGRRMVVVDPTPWMAAA